MENNTSESKIIRGSTPDLTITQILALVGATIQLLTVFGLDLSSVQREAIETWVQALLIIVGADVIIRSVRSFSKRF